MSSEKIKPGARPIPGESRKVAVLATEITSLIPSTGKKHLIFELQSCISICGGETLYAGSNVITALFGTGINTEQACCRAVDSGLRIMKAIDLFNRNLAESAGGLCFAGRIGISREDASVDFRGSVFAEYTEKLTAPPLDLLKTAGQGMILVSDEVKASCKDFFSWKKHPGGSWVPEKKNTHLSIHPLLTGIPLLGRRRETEHLDNAMNSFRKWHGHPPVLILGKPGTGKTTLMNNFLRRMENSSAKVVRLGNRLWDQPPLGMWSPLMEKGNFDPYGTIMTAVRQLTAEREVIVCIEDLHWADEASLKLLEQLFQAICDAGAFLLLSSRTGPGGTLENRSEKLTVSGLPSSAVRILVESILGRPVAGESARLAKILMERTAGNPLFVTELVLHSFETGAVGRETSGHWFIRKEPDDIVPLSAESFLQIRTSSLNPGEHFALQVASALGNSFTGETFVGVFSSHGYDSGEMILARLVNTGFLNEDEYSTFFFPNSVLPGTVYRSVIHENRVLIHRAAAEFLSARAEENPSGTAVMTLARHWMEAEYGEKAVPWLLKAMSQCLDLGDVTKAETLSGELHRRIDGESPPLNFQDARLQLLMGKFQLAHDSINRIIHTLSGIDLAKACFMKAQATENLGLPLKEAISLYEMSAKVAQESKDMNTKAQALSAAGSLYLAVGNRQKSLDSFSSALEHRSFLDTPSLAKLHGNIGILMHRTGSHEEALNHYGKTLELGRKCGSLAIEANALAFMGQVEINMGKREKGFEKYRTALSIHRKAGNRRGECTTLGNLGGQLARFGNTEDAIDMLEQAIRIAEDIGHTRGIMSFHSNLGLAYKIAGNFLNAEKHIRTAMEMIVKSGDKRALAVAHLNLCTVLSNMNRLPEAVEEARRALRFACSVNALTTQARALGNLGWLMINTDKPEMAVNFFRESYRRSHLAEDLSMLADSMVGEGKALFELGMLADSEKCLREAEKLQKKYGMDSEARNGLEELKAMLKGTGNEQNR